MNLAFDIDGVLYPWHLAVYNFLDSEGKLPGVSYSDFWINSDDYFTEEYWKYIVTIPTLLETILPERRILDFLEKIDSDGHSIYYITYRTGDSIERVTERYFKRYDFPQVHNLIFSKNKRDDIVNLEIDMKVDDRYSILRDLVGTCKLFTISRPWNWKHHDDFANMGITILKHVTELGEYL